MGQAHQPKMEKTMVIAPVTSVCEKMMQYMAYLTVPEILSWFCICKQRLNIHNRYFESASAKMNGPRKEAVVEIGFEIRRI